MIFNINKMNQIVFYVATAIIIGAVGYIANMLYIQYIMIRFYGNQKGVLVFPGAKRPLIGNIPEMLAYQKARISDTVVEVAFKWLVLNIS